MNEVNRLKILQDVIDGRLTTSLASQRLGITDRHCRRLLARYRASGPLALANRRRDCVVITSFCQVLLNLLWVLRCTTIPMAELNSGETMLHFPALPMIGWLRLTKERL